METKSYGQIAFEAYKEKRNSKAYDNTPIPNWADLKEEIKFAWNIAANEVIHEFLRIQEQNDRL